jgi:hypothetical protein
LNAFKDTYRCLAAGTALIVLISISLPADLLANEAMADFCPIPMEQKMPTMPAGHCDMPMPVEHHAPNPSQKGDMDKAVDCNFSLACTFNVVPVKSASTASPTAQGKIILPAADLDFTAASQPTYVLCKDLLPNLKSSPPPAFLVNSAFLN